MKKTIIIKGLILMVESLQKQLAEVKASYNALHDKYAALKSEARKVVDQLEAPDFSPAIANTEPTKDKIIETIYLGADIEPLALKCPLPEGYEMLPIHSILQAGDRWFSWQDKTYLPVKPRHIGRKVLGIGFLRSIAIS